LARDESCAAALSTGFVLIKIVARVSTMPKISFV
jgi:hypothetical protein